ncbi:hypothetical protein [Actinomadura sp. HBU206391]|uniref:hypothetical protein n=1 Tax=Actinomadura sp. HBU206391 TaxID=2731692 RepID=UPI00164EF77F|nr:hypothetical protein [Actinomadura sp. HBU206391]MBC6457129.1 hypothetical protein [Actinomadura sp. HBU206391]
MDQSAQNHIADLDSHDRRVREPAAAYLGDWLIGACRSRWDVSGVVNALVGALLREVEADVQEEIAHSLGHLVEYGVVPPEIVEPLATHLPLLDPGAAEHVAGILEAASWQKKQ